MDDRLTKKLFLKNHLSWSRNIEEVMELLRMGSNYDNLECCNLRLCKERLREQQNLELMADINNKPKLRIFKNFKTNSNTEEYLLHYLNKGHSLHS